MTRSACVLTLSICLILAACQRENPAPPSPAPVPPSVPSPPPRVDAPALTRDPNVDRRESTSDLIHNWKLPDVGKYTCPQGYRLDFMPQEKRKPGAPIWECRSVKDRSLPPKPVITRP
jgi:hypothetical protein